MRLKTALPALILALAGVPAAAQTFTQGLTHSVEGRFGVAYVQEANRPGRMEPVAGLRYTATLGHQLDSGMRLSFGVAVSIDNSPSPRPWGNDPFHRD